MSIVKPYTFVAGNKARANEVNEDFDVLYQQVNANITDIANVEGDVQTLSTTKADINGSSVQRFAVADPVSSGDAVNKRTFFKQIANSIDYIGGLTISKDSGSPNDTILIDPGAAYDSTKAIVLTLDVLTTKQNTTQSANATYYVYIIGNATGSSIDILISTEASVPTLPAGYTLYRKIGSYTTDSSGNIDIIKSGDGTVPTSISNVVAKYVNGVNGYVIYSDGLKIQWGRQNTVAQYSDHTITLLIPYSNSNYSVSSSSNYYQTAGDWTSSYALYPASASTMTLNSRLSQMNSTVTWMTIGY